MSNKSVDGGPAVPERDDYDTLHNPFGNTLSSASCIESEWGIHPPDQPWCPNGPPYWQVFNAWSSTMKEDGEGHVYAEVAGQHKQLLTSYFNPNTALQSLNVCSRDCYNFRQMR
jgi:hypothetical protein